MKTSQQNERNLSYIFLTFKIVLILIVMSLSVSLFAQSDPDPDEIKSFAIYQSGQFAALKSAADSLAAERGWVTRIPTSNGGVVELMSIGRDGIPKYYTTFNQNAARTSGTNNLWPDSASGLDLDGAGFVIGEWDGGRVKQLHQEFVGTSGTRVTLGDGLIDLSDHSTHVAGTLIAEGQVVAAHGMAPAALLHSYDWNDDLGEMASEYDDNFLVLSNHSYGYITGWYVDNENVWWWYGDVTISGTEDYKFGFYDDYSHDWDSLAILCPYYLIVVAAGNDRDDEHTGDHWVFYNGDWVPSNAERDPDGGSDGYDCIGNLGVSKNVLTVGAVGDIVSGYSVPSDVVMTNFSSWGPTDDGRIKPDIVANGTSLYSSISTTNSSYAPMSGTSMAAPTTTGTIALLQELYHSIHSSYMRSSLAKALIINSAYESGTTTGPDYKFGWGLLNSAGAAGTIIQDTSDEYIMQVNYLFNTEIETYVYYSTGDTSVNVTLCWTDPPGTSPNPSLNPVTLMLVNDLDLRIIRTSGSTYYPWMLNPASPASPASTGDNFRDNVEKVTIATPGPGEYTVRISHKGTTSGQYYALVISGLTSIRPTNTWTGVSSTNWLSTANWSLGHIPAGSEIVVIPAGCTNYPVLSSNLGIGYYSGYAGLCHSLNLENGATLTLNGTDLVSAGEMNIDGVLYIGDDLMLNDGAVVNLTLNGAIYTGYTNGYHGYLAMNDGSSVVQSGGNLYAEELLLNSGALYSASSGYFHIYKQETANTNQLIQVNDPDNHFYYFNIDTLANAYIDNSSEDINVFFISRVSGTLALNSFSMNAPFVNVYGKIILTTGSLNITNTGPVFNANSTLDMTGGEIMTNNSIWFNSGCNVLISDGTIHIRRDLYNQYGEFTPSGGKVRFFGDLQSDIKGPTTFYQLEIEKDTGITVLSRFQMHVSDSLFMEMGDLKIQNSVLHIGSGN
ncbi:MAG: S8 family serine peptidase [Bacteroidales bacterium]|nr:S8 family serine peptidase [Bacteroidales bacterium]